MEAIALSLLIVFPFNFCFIVIEASEKVYSSIYY